MCSVDSCYDEIVPDRSQENLTGAKCRKCQENSAKICLQRKLVYCQECFQLYFSHKYSKGLGKRKLLKNGDNVLVAFSGSPYSLCLVDLVHHSLNSDSKKKLKFEVQVVFIDERSKILKEERCELYKSIDAVLNPYGFTVYYTTLFLNGSEPVLMTNSDFSPEIDYETNSSLSDLKSDSIRQDLIQQLRIDVLFRAASKLKCNKILSAETSDHTAYSIICNLALGRGSQLPMATGTVEERCSILLIRPLRESSKKEVIFYNVFNKLSYHHLDITLEKDKFSSVQKLSEIFITELQHSFPSTVFTVVSTGSKLSSSANGSSDICCLCQSSPHLVENQLSALDALKVSHLVSNLQSEKLQTFDFPSLENSNNETFNHSFKSLHGQPTDIFQSPTLCYSCDKIFKEAVSMEDSSLEKKLLLVYKEAQNKRMHSEIQDFLI